VETVRPEVGVLVDAPGTQVPALASTLLASGMHVSFTLDSALSGSELGIMRMGDQAVPRLPTGGLVRWLGTRGQLHHLVATMGYSRHFLYASRGPSIGQWLLAHGAGGRPVAGAVRLDPGDSVGTLRAGEVVELSVANASQLDPLLTKLRQALDAEHLTAVPVGRLMHDAASTA
jgi:hypothetical protein